MNEKNFDFRKRHWEYHKSGRREPRRKTAKNEIELTADWAIGHAADAGPITSIAADDFRDYLEKSMDLSVRIVHEDGPRVLWLEVSPKVKKGFVIEMKKDHVKVTAAEDEMSFRGTIHLEDIMNLEGAPVLPLGKMVRRPMYRKRSVHSGSGIDFFPDAELLAMLHAGYDTLVIFLVDFDQNRLGYCDFNDIIKRAKRFGIRTHLYNYIQTYIHPDDPGATETFDRVYGEIFRRYPDAASITLCGESLEFPSKDPATTGKPYDRSVVDGIPDTRPSPGWYPCRDYPAYIQSIERAVHKVDRKSVV